MRLFSYIFFGLILSAELYPQVSNAAKVYNSIDGIVSIESENYQTSQGWRTRNYYTGVGITRDSENGSLPDFACYTINFEKPGIYYLHILGNRKLDVPFDQNGLQFKLAEESGKVVARSIAGFGEGNAPIWSSLDFNNPEQLQSLSVPAPGRYLLAVSALEGSGFYLDKIILALDPEYSPRGTGPEETTLAAGHAGSRDLIVLPPRWAFGVLYGGYTDQEQTIEVIDSLIQGDFPIDAYWIDSYFWDFNRGRGPKGYIDFVGDTMAFPDVGKMWGAFQDRKIKAGLWIWNMILEEGNESVYQDFRERNLFSSTFMYTNGWHNEKKHTMAGSIDFNNQDAVEYWKSKIKPFFDNGLDFLKLDNSSSMDFSRAAFTATQELGKETEGRGFILAHLHTTHNYEHKLYPTKWTGDAKIAWTQPGYPDLRAYAMGGLKENISMVSNPGKSTYEVPFLSHDAGGYDYFGSKDQSEELYMRWIQFSSMNSIMMFFSHNENPTRNHPYRYSEEVQQNFRKYTHMRMQLFPYIYTYALKTHLSGEKMIRGDAAHELQYLLGDEILVAPIFEKGARSRQLFLPEGNWIDPETNVIYDGNQEIVLDAPIHKLPLLIRQGSIIPKRNYTRAIELGDNDTLNLDIFPSDQLTTFELLEDDGLSNEYLEGRIASTVFSVQNKASRLDFTIQAVEGSYREMKNSRVYLMQFHGTDKPKWIKINGKKSPQVHSYHEGLQVNEIKIQVDTREQQKVSIKF